MKLNLSIHPEDYGFIIEAIKLRALSLIEALDMQKEAQEMAPLVSNLGPCSFSSAPVKQEGEPVSFTVNVDKQKKPHWTQTPRGKKIMAARKRKGQK